MEDRITANIEELLEQTVPTVAFYIEKAKHIAELEFQTDDKETVLKIVDLLSRDFHTSMIGRAYQEIGDILVAISE